MKIKAQLLVRMVQWTVRRSALSKCGTFQFANPFQLNSLNSINLTVPKREDLFTGMSRSYGRRPVTYKLKAASAFRQPSPTCRTAFPAQHLRPSDVLSCWPDGLELAAGFYPGSDEQHRLFRRLLKTYLRCN